VGTLSQAAKASKRGFHALAPRARLAFANWSQVALFGVAGLFGGAAYYWAPPEALDAVLAATAPVVAVGGLGALLVTCVVVSLRPVPRGRRG
jgi:hypothetical protein